MNVLIIALAALSSQIQAAEAWKVIAIVNDPACSEEVRILAKEGEKFVYAQHGNLKQKLVAQNGSVFSSENMNSTTFTPEDSEKTSLGELTMVFTQPSYVDGNPPKLGISYSGVQKHCRMKFNPSL